MQSVINKLLQILFSSLISLGGLEIIFANGVSIAVGDMPASQTAQLAIRFVDGRAPWALLLDPEMQLGELYMDGRWVVERGTIYEILALLINNMQNVQNARTNRWLDVLDNLRFARRRRVQSNDRHRAERNVMHHYDLGENLYDLFLDEGRQYSCAYFEHPDQTLEEAQLAKKRHIAAKLNITAGQTVLDIGCGWGGLALYLAGVANASSVLGITLSKEQLKTATQGAELQKLQDRVEYRLQDYRELQGRFDRIVSVGMFEHVGLPHYETYFQHCRRLLNENGVMLLHTIGCTGVPVHAEPWLDKYIFPGGYTPTLSQLMPAIEASGLVVSDIEVLRIHYASTLRIWRERFAANRDRALALSDERFCRMWEFYLASCEAVFRHDDVVVFQVQLAVRNDTVPLTRDYIAKCEEALRQREIATTS